MTDGQWQTIAWTSLSVAITLLVYAQLARTFGRPGRVPRRCLRCAYDMSHTDGMQCPECGRTWKREAQLYAFRGRRPAVKLAAALLFVAAGAGIGAQVVSGRWITSMPSALLTRVTIWTLPTIDAETPLPRRWIDDESLNATMLRVIWSRYSFGQLDADVANRVITAVLEHAAPIADLDDLNAPNAFLTEGRNLLYLADASDDLTTAERDQLDGIVVAALLMPAQWPADRDLDVGLAAHWWYQSRPVRTTVIDRRDDQVRHVWTWIPVHEELNAAGGDVAVDHPSLAYGGIDFGPPPTDGGSIPYTIVFEVERDDGTWHEVRRVDQTLRPTTFGTLAANVTGVSSPLVRAAETRLIAVVPRAVLRDGEVSAIGMLHTTALADELAAAGVTRFAVRIEVRHRDTLIAQRIGDWRPAGWGQSIPDIEPPARRGSPSFIAVEPVRPLPPDADLDALTVRITPVPERAAAHGAGATYWDGTITIPLHVMDH